MEGLKMMSLIPQKNENSLSYWCSWHTQNIVAKIDCMEKYPAEEAQMMVQGANGSRLARTMLNEELVFGENGYAHQYPDVRCDLYFMMDDGWDVDYGIHPDKNPSKFGSLMMSEERFPSVKGQTPAQRMKTVNEMLKALGWKGLGIWIAAQRAADDFKEPLGDADKAYWSERILWSREAGVAYWKVDWGVHAGNPVFRRMLTELGRELYPDLVIEHAACMGAVNAYDHSDISVRGRYMGQENTAANAKEVMAFSDVFRSYDVLYALCVPTTLDRVGSLLQWSGAVVNGEDECYINAVLGCSCGVMRSHYCQKAINEVGDDRGFRLQEVAAALRWQRLAPAFAGGEIAFSDEVLFDNRMYQKGDSWWGCADGQEVIQGAPAVIARNVDVNTIRVDGTVKPYVAASLNPSDAYSIGAFPRVIDGYHHYPKSAVHCEIPVGVTTIGTFGANCDMYLHLNRTPAKVYVQSLVGEEVQDMTDRLVSGDTVTLSAEDMQTMFAATDKTAPALLIRLEF